MSNETQRAKALATNHWTGYVGPLLEAHLHADTYTRDEVLRMCEFHYISSAVHGAKHALEDRPAGGMLAPPPL